MNHNHSETFHEKIQSGEFSFHPKLASWFREAFSLPIHSEICLVEYGCDSGSCNVIEVLVESIEKPDSKLKIGREKDKISKLDFQLSLQKQTSSLKNS